MTTCNPIVNYWLVSAAFPLLLPHNFFIFSQCAQHLIRLFRARQVLFVRSQFFSFSLFLQLRLQRRRKAVRQTFCLSATDLAAMIFLKRYRLKSNLKFFCSAVCSNNANLTRYGSAVDYTLKNTMKHIASNAVLLAFDWLRMCVVMKCLGLLMCTCAIQLSHYSKNMFIIVRRPVQFLTSFEKWFSYFEVSKTPCCVRRLFRFLMHVSSGESRTQRHFRVYVHIFCRNLVRDKNNAVFSKTHCVGDFEECLGFEMENQMLSSPIGVDHCLHQGFFPEYACRRPALAPHLSPLPMMPVSGEVKAKALQTLWGQF